MSNQDESAHRATARGFAKHGIAEFARAFSRAAAESLAADTRQRLEDLEQEQSNQGATAALKFETALKSKQMDFAAKLESGEIKLDDAERMWGAEVSGLRDVFISPLHSTFVGRSGSKIASAVALQADRVSAASSLHISGSVLAATVGTGAASKS